MLSMINPDGGFAFKNISLSSLKMSKLGLLVGSRCSSELLNWCVSVSLSEKWRLPEGPSPYFLGGGERGGCCC